MPLATEDIFLAKRRIIKEDRYSSGDMGGFRRKSQTDA
jgi:hypothetical protein